MKGTRQSFRMISLIFALIISIFLSVKAQVITRVLTPDDKIEKYIPWYNPNRKIPIVETPFVDVAKVLEQDRITNRKMPRIAIKQDINYTERDGKITEYSNYFLWEMVLHSENAKSMSVRFDNTFLPKKAIMFLYNEETRFVVGPITRLAFQNGTFRSDYLNGEKINISIFIPKLKHQNLNQSIYISSFDYGIFQFKLYDNDFNTSGPCNINFVCDGGWQCQGESVCKIIHSNGICTGALINNDCCDLTPYILTANHCTNIFPVDDYVFRFNYQSPDCTPNGETPPTQWIVYFGSELKASWSGTDFSLLELSQELKAIDGISFSGWDKINFLTPNSVCIHHPHGDVKKISYDNDPNNINGNYHEIVWDAGTAEGGSSGAPLYNNQERIIGQLSGGQASCTNIDSSDFFGRFDLSWEGNGTNTTRLRDWLGASTNPNTMDCMKNPYIQGSNEICEESELYILHNNMPCSKKVTWQVEPTNLFYDETNGDGNFAQLNPKPNAQGQATLTFTLSSPNCNDIFITKDIWIGKPDFDIFGDDYLCLNDFGFAFIDPFSTYIGDIQWSIGGAISGSGTGIKAKYRSERQPGWGWVCASMTNSCGTTTKCLWVQVEDCDWGKGDKGFKKENNENINLNFIKENNFLIYPNPSSNEIILNFQNQKNKTSKEIQIINVNGVIIKSILSSDNQFKIKVNLLPEGIYIIKCKVAGNIFYKKFIKS